MLDGSDQQAQQVDWLVGACLLVRLTAFEQVGGFDERFFMYFEETDLCRRLKAAGWSIEFEPDARARHLGGRSSDQAPARRQCEFNESKCRYARKWHGLIPAVALRWFLFGVSACQLAEEAAKLVLRPQSVSCGARGWTCGPMCCAGRRAGSYRHNVRELRRSCITIDFAHTVAESCAMPPRATRFDSIARGVADRCLRIRSQPRA